MADEWINIALRFAVYMDLGTTFGVSLFGVYALRLDSRSPPIAQRYARVVAAGALVGIMLSIGAMAVLAKPRRPPKLPHLWPPKLLHLAGVN